jgi:ligand-binding sensor domain-containing protein
MYTPFRFRLPTAWLPGLALCLLTLPARAGGAPREDPGANPVRSPGTVGGGPAVIDGAWPGPADPADPDLNDQISDFVRRIHEDRRGHLWFGTNGDGVCRYDGRELRYFGRAQGFPGDAVRAIVEEPDGTLWFGTSEGVIHFDGRDFTTYDEEDGLPSRDVWSLLLDRQGVLWAGTYGGACRLDRANARFSDFPLPPAPRLDPDRGVTSLEIVFCMLEDRGGDLWFAVGCGGVYRYDGRTLAHLGSRDGLCDDSVNCMLQARNGEIWFATPYNGVCRWDGRRFTSVGPAEGVQGHEVWNLFEDSAGRIWFPVENHGVYHWNGRTFINHGKGEGLASSAIQCTFEDRRGRLWFGGYLGAYRLEGSSFVNVTREGPWP